MMSLGLIKVETSWDYWLQQWATFQDNSYQTKIEESPTPAQREAILYALKEAISSRGCSYHLGQYTEAGIWKGDGRATVASILFDSTLALLIAWCKWLSEN